MEKKIRRRCKGGCGGITSPGKKYILGHYWENKKHTKEHKLKKSLSMIGNTNASGPRSKETKLNMSLAQIGKKKSKETKSKMSLAAMGNTNGKGLKGYKQSKEHKRNSSIAHIKYNPNDKYCDIWRDKEYRKDIRKDYCENKDCKGKSKRFINHHIYLDKKRCAPNEVMTLCNSCHSWLHNILQDGKKQLVNPKDYIIINRPDHVSYIHKPTRKIIKVEKEES